MMSYSAAAIRRCCRFARSASFSVRRRIRVVPSRCLCKLYVDCRLSSVPAYNGLGLSWCLLMTSMDLLHRCWLRDSVFPTSCWRVVCPSPVLWEHRFQLLLQMSAKFLAGPDESLFFFPVFDCFSTLGELYSKILLFLPMPAATTPLKFLASDKMQDKFLILYFGADQCSSVYGGSLSLPNPLAYAAG